MQARVVAAAGLGILALGAAVLLVARRGPTDEAQCGAGFIAVRARCCRTPACEDEPPAHVRIAIPAVHATLGPSDWEAEGRVAPRALVTAPFALDAFETTRAQIDASYTGRDRARAASGVTRDEAVRYCEGEGGRLPTEDEWIAAAAGDAARRYPWGDTGLVCRRAAWGLADGPCSIRGDGPDTVGAHPDGDTPLGAHDLAGNVAEWVRAPNDERVGIARGGSWRTGLASELRTWARLEVDPGARDDRIGVRCAYDAPR